MEEYALLRSRDFYDDSGSLSRKNSYCSHGSRWSYSSHADPMLLLYRSASRSGGCYFGDSKAATDFYKAAEYYHTKQPEFHHSGGVAVTEELNYVAVVHEKEVEAAAVPTAVVNGGPPPGWDSMLLSLNFD